MKLKTAQKKLEIYATLLDTFSRGQFPGAQYETVKVIMDFLTREVSKLEKRVVSATWASAPIAPAPTPEVQAAQ